MTLFEFVEPGPFGLAWAVVPTLPVQIAFVAAVAAALFASI